ncbi:MAG: Ig-like domain-containing protein, partial [Dethiobacteria bacterium]
MKKKMFHGFLPIFLCMMLLAGAVIPAVPAVTHAEGGEDLLEPPGLAVGLAGTSLDSPDSFLESASEDDVQEDTVTNTVYGEATPERTSMGVGILSEGPTVTVTGNGVENPQTFDLSEFIDEHPDAWVDARVYSTINTWPSKKWYVAEGVKVAALLEEADIKDEAQLIKVKASDGYVMAFTRKELLEDTRYYFPNFKEEGVDGDGHIPGSPEGAEPVDAILALQSVEGSDNPGYMDPLNCPLLVLGQRGVTEQTNHTFVKKVAEIEVSCDFPLKHVKPTADPSGGEVPVGTEVTLTNQRNDDDKIYYTTDGSDPNVWDSLIYNWVASRWWSQRGEEAVAEINHPIVLTEDTTIKAKTIGFGREDSDIVTFEYTVYTVDVIGVSIDEDDQELKEGETVQLTAIVEPEDATDKSVTWSSSNEDVATVDETGLVTAVAEGEAEITVTTNDGDFTDSITVTVKRVLVTGVSILEENQTLPEGATVQLTAIVEPEDATDKSVTWSSSNEDVATVDETGLVTAVAEG